MLFKKKKIYNFFQDKVRFNILCKVECISKSADYEIPKTALLFMFPA